jgi:L-rhamnose isomerase
MGRTIPVRRACGAISGGCRRRGADACSAGTGPAPCWSSTNRLCPLFITRTSLTGHGLELARGAVPQAKVLVDIGHHYQGTNVEQIVAWQLELNFECWVRQAKKMPAFMIDLSHNLKGKVEAMVANRDDRAGVVSKALVDQERLAELQDACRLVEAEEEFRSAFWFDVRPLLREWRTQRQIPTDPLAALRESGYMERITAQRGAKKCSQPKFLCLTETQFLDHTGAKFIRGTVLR